MTVLRSCAHATNWSVLRETRGGSHYPHPMIWLFGIPAIVLAILIVRYYLMILQDDDSV